MVGQIYRFYMFDQLSSCHFSKNRNVIFNHLPLSSDFLFFFHSELLCFVCKSDKVSLAQQLPSVYYLFFFTVNPVTILSPNAFLIVVSCIDQKISMLCSTFVHNCLPVLTPPPIWAAQSCTNEVMISDSLSLLKISVLMINTMCFGKIVPNFACES